MFESISNPRLTRIMMTSQRTYRDWFKVMGLVLIGWGLVACGSDEGNIGNQNAGRLQVTPSSVTFPQTPPGDTSTQKVTLTNVGDSTLTVFDMGLKPADGESVEQLDLKGVPDGQFEIEPGTESAKTFDIEFTPESRGSYNAGVIEIRSSDTRFSRDEALEIDVFTLENQPQLQVSPSPVQFPQLTPGESFTRTVTVTNIGGADLKLYEAPSISGSDAFEIASVDRSFPVTLGPVSGAEQGGDGTFELSFEVTYEPTSNASDTGDIVFKTNEDRESNADDPTTSRVSVEATADTPCLRVEGGRSRTLGSVPIGGSTQDVIRIENCGSKTVVIDQIDLVKNSRDEEFELDLGDRDGNDDGQLDDPIEFQSQGESAQFEVQYQPTAEGRDQATVALQTNDPVQPEVTLDVTGRGAEGSCPSAALQAKVRGKSAVPKEQVAAAPLDYIILDASESSDEDGRIVEFDWRVLDKPEDVDIDLSPPSEGQGETDDERVFRLLTAGEYEIGLTVKDNDGFVSCNEATVTITAIPNEQVHVELTWTNPEDPDEQDDRGSDVDVHMVKMGPGKWFEAPYDIYFQNQGSGDDSGIWNPESPSLDIDDTDGAGPENIQMDDPARCQWYAVGVHYYKQLFGTAYATIRIYINEELVYERPNQPLRQGGEFWDVARIHWPTGRVIGHDRLYPSAPREESPTITEAMESSGLCTAENLYATSQ